MRNRVWRRAVLGFLAAGMVLRFCSVSYAASLDQLLTRAKEQEAAVTGEVPDRMPDSRFLVSSRAENDVRVISIAGQCLAAGKEQAFYVIGRNYMPEGSVLPAVFGPDLEYSCTLEGEADTQEDHYRLVRFAVRDVGISAEEGDQAGNGNEAGSGTQGGNGSEAGGGSQEGNGNPTGGGHAGGGQDGNGGWPGGGPLAERHWSLGDTVTRWLDGVPYRFRCIDQNYRDGTADGQSLALFLCDSVVPADTGSLYEHRQLEDGSWGNVFTPGPIVNFGESGRYADSAVRRWLAAQEEDADTFPRVNVGVERGYLGRTEAGSRSRFSDSVLRPCQLGSQILNDHYFILSVEEALKYREHLWRIDGMDEEETAENAGTFAKGYWLRTPSGKDENAGYVYIVDLANGNLHPQAVRPLWEMAADERREQLKAAGEDDLATGAGLPADDEELAVTSPVGVRPAFVMKQDH